MFKDKKLRKAVEKLSHVLGISFCDFYGELQVDRWQFTDGGDYKKRPLTLNDIAERNILVNNRFDEIEENQKLLLEYLKLHVVEGKRIEKI